jgi:hypothetical protein
MPKSKSNVDRSKRAPRDPSPEREAQAQKEREDGVVEEELDELDTDKYEPAPRKEH